MPVQVQSQPKSNPFAAPQTSLSGTMAQPAPVDMGGIAVPPDYAALLQGQAQQPVPYAEAPGGMDMLLGVLGGLLSGSPGAIFKNIVETRAKGREVKEANLASMQENARARTKLMMEGMRARREDEEGALQKKLDALRLEGDEQKIAAAKAELERTRDIREMGFQERELQLQRANLSLERARMQVEEAGSEEARKIVNYAAQQMPLMARQLETQLRLGAKEPVLKVMNPDTGEIEEIVGLEAIQSEFENDLTALTSQLAIEDALPLRDSVDEAFNQMLQPLLDQWAARVTKGRVEAAQRGKERAKAGIKKYSKEAQKSQRGARTRASEIKPLD